jgi:heme-degrading monooxygenase HmoA
MFITFTSSTVTEGQGRQVDEFLAEFLPRLKRQPGVLGIYHFSRPDKGDELTVIVWQDEEAVRAYRQSELIKESMAFEEEHHLPSTREGYPLIYAVSDKIEG